MKVEIRSDDSCVISGYVNAVGRESRVLRDACGSFVEVVEPGTFARALSRGKNIDLMYDHQRTIGSTATCLELEEDNIGLRAHAVINDPDVVACARNGKLTGWSFGFHVESDDWKTKDDGMRLRTLKAIDLVEVSILDVTPAYVATSVEMRDESGTFREYRSVDETVEVEEAPAQVEAQDEQETSAEGETASVDVVRQLKSQRQRFYFNYVIKKGNN